MGFIVPALFKSAGPPLDDQLAALAKHIWLDPSRLDTGFVARDGSGPNAGNGDPVGRRLDRSGNNRHAIATADDARPTLLISGGVNSDNYDGVNDQTEMDISGRGSTMEDVAIFIGIDTTKDNGLLGWGGFTSYVGQFRSTNNASPDSASGDPTYYKNGVILPSQVQSGLYAGYVNAGKIVAEIRGAYLPTFYWTSDKYTLAGYTSPPRWYGGLIGPFLMMDTAIANANRDSIILPWFAERGYGL